MRPLRFSSAKHFGKAERDSFVAEIWSGATNRWGEDISPEIADRIELEIATFERVDGYMSYLYFVWSVVKKSRYFFMPYLTFAHASAVCYALNITKVDPIKLKLDFNRFMLTDNPVFSEITLATNATQLQIQTEIQFYYFEHKEEFSALGVEGRLQDISNSSLGRLELNPKAKALIVYPSHRRAQLLGYMNRVVDIDSLPLDDSETYKALLNGKELSGVYGCEEGSPLRDYLKISKPCFEDLITICASSIINVPTNHTLLLRKYGLEYEPQFASEVEDILSETSGEILYKEQFMAIAQLVAGLSQEEADSFRRMVSRQQKRKYQAFRSRFKEHKELFRKLINDGKWMVSKAGVAEYAYMVYTTAYLKRHYEREYTEAALLVAAGKEF